MAGRFEGKAALVTGGSRGIGRAIVEALIKEGAETCLIGRVQSKLIKKLGIIDFLVNNAGTTIPNTEFVDIEKSTFENVLDTNFKGSFNIAQVVSKCMVLAGRPGVIIDMSSMYGLKALAKNVPYSVSKAMMEMLTKVMALELGPHKVRVNNLNPTFIKTDMTEPFLNNKEFIDPILQRYPIGHFGELKDLLDDTLWLLSDEAAMVTGTSVPVDGGFLIS
ncbi:hypothetical protein KUTeg_000828 [Tegillarca granosa]|uniref:Uncharacterized protein n=1 Tax=Tegillarca granosa TaxID=220873 RepID=A0ABQ9FYN1_TEGGR|nr:hypothetical protein KUTeg_000828 [Tegillarca granosa]